MNELLHSKTGSQSFDTVVADVTARLKEQGFGLLSDIDVQATLKSKIGADYGKVPDPRRLQPTVCTRSAEMEDKLGVLLPCNVIVRETADKRVEVASVDPVAAMERVGNPALKSTAEEVRRLLTAAVQQIGT